MGKPGFVDLGNGGSMRLAIKLIEILMNLVYLIIKIFVPVTEKITLLSRQSDTPSLDFQLLNEELNQRGVKTVMLCRKLDKTLLGMVRYCFHMLRQMWNIGGSRGLVLDGYSIAASMLKHKKNLKIFQIWHSMGSMKDFGYTVMGKAEGSSYKLAKAMKMHCNYDYVLISSDAYKQSMIDGFHCDADKIYIKPLPRLDLLTGNAYAGKIKKQIYENYPELQDKKNILYCPTFRKDEEESLKNALDSLIDRVDKEKYNLIVKLHPLSKVEIDKEYVIAGDKFTTFDMIFAADYVISDYSCVVYEAAVRQIPLYFFAFDLKKYEGNRGLAIDYLNECPGLISADANEILSSIESGKYDMAVLQEFADKYVHPTCHATKDMVDFILEKMKIHEEDSE